MGDPCPPPLRSPSPMEAAVTTAIATDTDRLGSTPSAPLAHTAGNSRGTILSGLEAVNEAERALCGVAAVLDPARAEGLALAGMRAASLLGGADAESAAAPIVVHRTRHGAPLGAFELVAESAQQAVDHCVVAHRATAAVGDGGVCVLPPSLAADLAFVRLPGAGSVDGAVSGGGLLRAFEDATRAIGRPCRPFTALHAEGADHLIVAVGLAAPLARRLVDLLRARNVSCGAVSLALVRPVVPPVAELAQRRATVVLLTDGTLGGDSTEVLGRALAEGGAKVVSVSYVPGNEAEVAARVAAALGGDVNGDLGALRVGPPPVPARSVAVAAAPADRWSEDLLRGALSWLGERIAVARPEAELPGVVAFGLARAGMRPTVSDGYDVLFVAHPHLLDPQAIGRLRSGGTVVVQSPAADAAALWAEIWPAQRRALAARSAVLRWVDGAVAGGPDGALADSRLLLQGAILGSVGGLGTYLGAAAVATDGIPTVGDGAIVLAGIGALKDAGPAPETAPARPAGRGLPRRQEAVATPPNVAWRDMIRSFHVTGQGGWTGADPLPTLPLMPLLLGGFLGADGVPGDLPLVLTDAASGPVAVPLARVLGDAVASWEAERGASVAVRPNLGRLLQVVRQALRSVDVAPATAAVGKALDDFGSSFKVSAEAGKALGAELAHVRAAIPAKARLVGLSRRAVLEVHAAALVRARRGAAKALAAEADVLAHKLRDLLRVDDSKAPAGRTAAAIGAGIGAVADGLVDAAALAKTLGAARGAKAMEPARRARIERALAGLQTWLERGEEPTLVLHGGLLAGLEMDGVRVAELRDPLESAIGAFDGRAARIAEVLRHMRIARLEATGSYDPSRHDAAIARLGWESFAEGELRAVPSVVVVVKADAIWGSLASFSNLLRSGRPVHVLVLEGAMGARAGQTAELASGHFGLGYLAVAHRDAFVLQGTLARGEHLAGGLERMARAARPAVAVVAEPSWDSPVPAEVQLEAAHQGRGTPCFVHDPDAGATWAERFDLSGNPSPEDAWVMGAADILDASGQPARVEGMFTYAHGAALDPNARPHLRLIPAEAWSDEQAEVAAWLTKGDDGAPQVPYVEVVDEEGVVRRAVISRDLAWAARDRAQFWRVLGELAGERNEHAVRAVATARVAAEAEAKRLLAEQAVTFEAELGRVRSEAAGEALERVARVLLDLDLATPASAAPQLVAASVAALPAAAEAAPAAPVAAAAAPAAEEDDVSFDDPYIDTILCTTCNECVNLNPKMFKYNADKQATLADLSAGNYAQLVAAAGKCSARCIHPGKPRKGDASATPEVLARAAAL